MALKVYKPELSEEEYKKTALMLKFSLLRIYTLFKAANEDYDFICNYWGMINKQFRSPLNDSFEKIEHVLFKLEKQFKKSGHVEQQHIDNQTESSFDIMEFIENEMLPKTNNYLNDGMGIEFINDLTK